MLAMLLAARGVYLALGDTVEAIVLLLFAALWRPSLRRLRTRFVGGVSSSLAGCTALSFCPPRTRVFAGTILTRGSGTASVCATGERSRMGLIGRFAALEILGRILRSAVSRRANSTQRAELLTLTNRQSGDLAAGAFTTRMNLDWDIIDNPVLALMERTLTAHSIRLISVSRPVYVPRSEETIRQERERLIATAWQDVKRADQIFEDMYSRTRSGRWEPARA